jgi:hypothetical protein
MQLPMMAAAERHGELVADLHAQRCPVGDALESEFDALAEEIR